jgi:hypothetical protein
MPMATAYHEIADQVQHLDLDAKMHMKELLERWIIEERRAEIRRNADAGLQEHAAGKLKGYDNAVDLMKALNAD